MMMVRRGYAPHEELRFRVLEGLFERMRGLLGTGGDAQPIALVGCSSIHTFGMRYRIDVAFIGSSGLVLEAWYSVPPGRLLSNRRAWVTLERPHGRGPWFARGELVKMERSGDGEGMASASGGAVPAA